MSRSHMSVDRMLYYRSACVYRAFLFSPRNRLTLKHFCTIPI